MKYVLVAAFVALLGISFPAPAGELDEIVESPDAWLNENFRDWVFRQSTEIREFGCEPVEHIAWYCEVDYWPLAMHGCTHLFDEAGAPLVEMQSQYGDWWDALTFGGIQCANQSVN